MLTLVIVVVSFSSSKCGNSNDTGTITVAAPYTTSGDTTADVVQRSDLPERYSFSFLHKWNFLFPLGRTVQNGAISVAVAALVLLVAGLGLRLYPAARRARRRRLADV
ncbi:MAG: hypothetical protein RLW61_07625 [Gammaproteobacteria bacterium]